MGAALRLDSSSGVRAFASWLVAVKLLALPLIAIGVGTLFGLSGLNFQVCCLPPADRVVGLHSGHAHGGDGGASPG